MAIATPEVYAEMLQRAKEQGFAYPAVNVTSSQTLNAAIRGFVEAGSDGMAKSLELMEKMRDEGASDHEIDVALAEAKLPSVVQVGRKSLMRWPSWWWLNRRERALRAKITRLMKG